MILKIIKTAAVYFALLTSKTSFGLSATVSFNQLDANNTDPFPGCTNSSVNDWCNSDWGPIYNYSTPLANTDLINCYKSQKCPIIDFVAIIIGELGIGVSGAVILCLFKKIPEKYRKIATACGSSLLLTGMSGGLSGIFYLIAHDPNANNSNPAIAIPLKEVTTYCALGGAITGIGGTLFYLCNKARINCKREAQIYPQLR